MPSPSGMWCLGGCKTLISRGDLLCVGCRNDLAKYGDENPKLVERLRKLAQEGPIADVEHLLASHAAFEAWLKRDKEEKT